MSISALLPYAGPRILERVATAAREGLTCTPKRLPPWLFYDETGSRLFDEITELPEYYLTRTERAILYENAGAINARAAAGERLRLTELGAGSADKTRLLLAAACRRQGHVAYEPVDVSGSALEAAQERIEREIPGVRVEPQVMDYTEAFELDPATLGERRLVLYIGSSIGNFEPEAALRVLERVHRALRPGDAMLLGVDLVKDETILQMAYDDAAGVTAAFNRNMLARLNRELGAEFELENFAHCAVWNPIASRMEIYLESCKTQTVYLGALEEKVKFGEGERIHTENSYKYRPGQPEALLARAGFKPEETWTDKRGWFAVALARRQ